MEGIFAILKPKGPTSHDIVNELRLITKIKKIGHAGTLDPLAKGVLVVGIGSKYTKKLNFYLNKEKKYLAEIELGKESRTDDDEGIKKKINVKIRPKKSEIEKIILEFKGNVMQKPPLFSAIKINGVRAYKLARSNQSVKMKARKVEIKEISIKKYSYPKLTLEIITGPGVYIRSLARDMGQKMKTGAYLKELTRTKVGDFSLNNSLTLSQFKKINNLLCENFSKRK